MSALWKAAGDFLLYVLNSLYSFTHSYGIAIIVLTILIRILLHPLSHKQLVSMQKMQKLQPRMKILQEKYADDKDTLNKEIMKLYKENKVNPAAGCLPLLVQLPILILLFRVLMNLDLGGASFLGISLEGSVLSTLGYAVGVTGSTPGIKVVLSGIMANPAGLVHISAYAANLILLLGVGFLTWFQQKLSGSAANPQMQFMSWFMPVFLTFICLSLPGGVLLYWGVSSLIGVVQQWHVKRKTEVEMQEKPVLLKDKPPKKDPRP
ncbi:MAG: YidC/Oxa1 family membrane protein insertase [Thermovirga sp.]